MAIGYGVPCQKPIPRVLDRIEQKRELAATERACRKAVDARDQRRCFFPNCRAFANEKHHIQPRSLGGRWQTWNILSACTHHHRWFKAGLIEVAGNPDKRRVRVLTTALGARGGILVPEVKP
jgi:hypothetical protein